MTFFYSFSFSLVLWSSGILLLRVMMEVVAVLPPTFGWWKCLWYKPCLGGSGQLFSTWAFTKRKCKIGRFERYFFSMELIPSLTTQLSQPHNIHPCLTLFLLFSANYLSSFIFGSVFSIFTGSFPSHFTTVFSENERMMIIKMYLFFKCGFKKYSYLFELYTGMFMNEKPHVWGLRQNKKKGRYWGV